MLSEKTWYSHISQLHFIFTKKVKNYVFQFECKSFQIWEIFFGYNFVKLAFPLCSKLVSF